jgi:DNA-binding transcriptional LysR family regulator
MAVIPVRHSGGMTGSQLQRLDLNLLVALDALLQERGVSKAAARLGLGQPALSASLARLRRHFGDELLIRRGNTYELTPMAVQLRTRCVIALAGVDRVFSGRDLFEPATSRRTFTIYSSDYAMAVLAGPVCDVVQAEAPHVRIRFDQHTPAVVERGAEALREMDGMLLPHGFLSQLPYLDVFADEWACLVSATNPEVGHHLTLDALGRLSWVFSYHTPAAFTPGEVQLQLLGVEPNVQAVVSSFLALPAMVRGSNRVALIQRRLAAQYEDDEQLRILPCPFDVVPLSEAFWWHPVHDQDPEHIWLRSLIARAAATLM